MIVMKFGGSSVKDAEMFLKVADIVKSKLSQKPVVVLSAVKGTTDHLIESIKESIDDNYDAFKKIEENHKKIIKDLNIDQTLVDEELNELKKALEVNSKEKDQDAKLADYISYFGERMSVKILAALLNKQNTKAESFVSGDIGLLTDSNFGDATILKDSPSKLKDFINKLDLIPIITGFGGKDKKKEFTTFNRGGSDYVAALIGAAIDAEEIQIWTDVNGIMSSDPRLVDSAKTIPELSFDEASELAYFGAKVLHPKTILPAIEKNIPVLVLNTFEPDNKGSTIVKTCKKNCDEFIKAISYKKGITIIDFKSTRMLDAHGFLLKIFEVFEKYKKPIDMIATSEINVSLSVDSKEDLDNITKELKDISRINISENQAIIYVVGTGMKNKPGSAGRIFQILGKNNINVGLISQCSEEVSVGFVVDEKDAEETVKVLHKELIQ
jgi:aspartate kinase